jgi:hypothetical protein
MVSPAGIHWQSLRSRFALVVLFGCLLVSPYARADGPRCRLLRYTFEPDCLGRGADGRCHFDVSHPDLGPQVAVWIESADGSRFIDTLMVTNAVALYGIGNRPGRWDLPSGPRFPYGRRPMALPVWAHRRGILYDSVTMEDGRDDELASHQEISSPEPYFCRPMMASEVIDAVTCASGNFRSAKGVFDHGMTRSFYPPRGDLIDWGNVCIQKISIDGAGCDDGDARQFGLINDVDAVATATPRYDQSFTGTWSLPPTLPDGDYALMVEVGKEFDANATFSHPAFLTPYERQFYGDYGLPGNVGQPSVVYRLAFHVSAEAIPDSGTTDAVGYSDFTGNSGDVTAIDAAPDATPGAAPGATPDSQMDPRISDGTGSGVGRLRLSDGAGGVARVHLQAQSCPTADCSALPPPDVPRMDAPTANQDPAAATFELRQTSDNGARVLEYEMRYQPANQSAIDETTFDRWTPAPAPPVAAPGTLSTVTLGGLTPNTGYAIGLRAHGACGWSRTSFIRIYVGPPRFKRLSGCVIATAAYGSDLHPDVALLRHERDWAAEHSGLARLGALLYGDSAPALATLLARSDVARTVVRALLRPLILVNRAALAATTIDPGAPPAPP